MSLPSFDRSRRDLSNEYRLISQRFLDLEIRSNQNLGISSSQFFKIDFSGGFIFFQKNRKNRRRLGWGVQKSVKKSASRGVGRLKNAFFLKIVGRKSGGLYNLGNPKTPPLILFHDTFPDSSGAL